MHKYKLPPAYVLVSKQVNLLLERKRKAVRQRGRAGRQLVGTHIITFKSEN